MTKRLHVRLDLQFGILTLLFSKMVT